MRASFCAFQRLRAMRWIRFRVIPRGTTMQWCVWSEGLVCRFVGRVCIRRRGKKEVWAAVVPVEPLFTVTSCRAGMEWAIGQ